MRLSLPVTEMGSLHQASHLVCNLVNIGRRFRARYLEASGVTCTPKYLNEVTTWRYPAHSGNGAVSSSKGRRADLLQLMEKPEKVPNCVIIDITFDNEVEVSPKYRRASSAYNDILSVAEPLVKPSINGDALTVSASGSKARANSRGKEGTPASYPRKA